MALSGLCSTVFTNALSHSEHAPAWRRTMWIRVPRFWSSLHPRHTSGKSGFTSVTRSVERFGHPVHSGSDRERSMVPPVVAALQGTVMGSAMCSGFQVAPQHACRTMGTKHMVVGEEKGCVTGGWLVTYA
jgi:hypothetical protein